MQMVKKANEMHLPNWREIGVANFPTYHYHCDNFFLLFWKLLGKYNDTYIKLVGHNHTVGIYVHDSQKFTIWD